MMFKYFDEEYPIYDDKGHLIGKGLDLSSPKKFYVYRGVKL